MKKFLTAAVALSVLASAGAASAQSYQGRQGYGGYEQNRDDRARGDDRVLAPTGRVGPPRERTVGVGRPGDAD